jgi:hypothetical protein
MVHGIQLAIGAFMRSLGGKGRTKSWETCEHDHQFGGNKSIDFGKCQCLAKEGNAEINKVSAMRPDLPKIIEKVHISWYFESPETDLHIVEHTSSIDSADTWLLKRDHWLSPSQCPHCSTSDYGCEDKLGLNTEVSWVRLLITGIHVQVAPKSTI